MIQDTIDYCIWNIMPCICYIKTSSIVCPKLLHLSHFHDFKSKYTCPWKKYNWNWWKGKYERDIHWQVIICHLENSQEGKQTPSLITLLVDVYCCGILYSWDTNVQEHFESLLHTIYNDYTVTVLDIESF